MLIELHILQNHAPGNLNRDDTGSPKDCIFGDVRRARISSQCIKRSIRRSDLFQQEFEADHLATRTRRLPALVRECLVERGNLPEEWLDAAAEAVVQFGQKAKDSGDENSKSGKKDGAASEDTMLQTQQTMFITQADIDAISDVLENMAVDCDSISQYKKALKPSKKNDLQAAAELAGFRPVTPDIALFGRMTTSRAFRDVQASCQVAHAISTHKVDHEFDYYTAVDDLLGSGEEEEDPGADMIGDVEFNSACYYKYYSINPTALTENLTGKLSYHRKDVAPETISEAVGISKVAIRRLIQAAALVTPTGKQNSFASHTPPALVFVEVRPQRTPISYANAFVEPVRVFGKTDLVGGSVEKLVEHADALTRMYNLDNSARLWCALNPNGPAVSGAERCDDLATVLDRLDAILDEAHAEGRLHG